MNVSTARPALCIGLTTVAVSAWAGAALMATGALDVGETARSRMPFASPVLASVALALVVGVPMTAAAVLAYRGDRRLPDATVAAGILLVGWIAVEAAVIREFSPLQVLFAGIGLVLAEAGRRLSRPGRHSRRTAVPRH